MKKLLIGKNIITVNSNNDILKNAAIEIIGGIISNIFPIDSIDLEKYDGEIINRQYSTIIPGFVQTHVHLCQTLFRGLAEDMELLDWLQKKIFPYENSHNKNSLKCSAQLGLFELQKSGTTTILDMGTINYQEIIFEEIKNSSMRAFAGKCMVDINDLYPSFIEDTEISLKQSYELAKEFHNSNNGKIKYGFAPRFVLSCSEHLLQETKAMMNDFEGAIYHTHSSENKSEIEAVKKLHNKENIEYFDSIGILSDHTVLAHGIHVNDNEVQFLKDTNTRVSHCPSSNLKLGSGIANIPRYIKEGISVSLGADGAPCNNNLSQFTEMRLASLIQKPIHGPTAMDAKTTFRLATIDGAKALHLDNEIGSIEIGKKADLVCLDLNKVKNTMNNDNIYSSIIYSSSNENVTDVMIEGEFVVEKGEHKVYDEEMIINESRNELNKLLKRAKVK